MRWFWSWCGWFPERLLKVLQYLRGFWLVELEDMVSSIYVEALDYLGLFTWSHLSLC